ncbi:adenylate/guanylate cyclase domain-containing protein [Christiangramia aquimixticola]|uniref:adenylate/guanylate cyclase domain-containing protein n=1 Tax=Christiangramia aquimixticola TaxID=1697558 RepID=UPI003AA8B33E
MLEMEVHKVCYKFRVLYILFLLITLFPHNNFGQNQDKADSLEVLYNSSSSAKNNLEVLDGLAINTADPIKRLKYANELLTTAKKKNASKYFFQAYFQKGYAYFSQGDYTAALESFYNAATLAKTKNDLGQVKVTIGDVYSLTGNHDRSMKHYHEAIEIFRETENEENLGRALFNAGDEYLKNNKVEKAISYLKEAEQIFIKMHFDLGLAYCKGTLGLAYAKLNMYDEAEANLQEAIQSLEKKEDYMPICEFLNGMSDIYADRGLDSTAIEFALISRDLAKSYGFKNEIREANLRLSKIHEKKGNIPESYKFYKEYITYRDSVLNVSTAQNMAGLRADYEVSQKQAEVDLLSEKQKNQQLVVISIAVASFLICLLAFGLYRRNKFIKRTSKIIENERNRAESLLLNILPEETARELKKYGKVKAKKFESVTVLFADFKKFTLYAERLSPEKLIESVDFYFSKFDEIIEKYGIEKIKTIGDSYMAASGLPFPNEDHAIRMVKAAFEMIQFVEESKGSSIVHDADFDVRIGINSGPVIAGVVGTKKFAYDIWGDTVNIAARMESHSDIGRINISENTYRLIQKECNCEYRGEVEVKNGRLLNMYYVNSFKKQMKETLMQD